MSPRAFPPPCRTREAVVVSRGSDARSAGETPSKIRDDFRQLATITTGQSPVTTSLSVTSKSSDFRQRKQPSAFPVRSSGIKETTSERRAAPRRPVELASPHASRSSKRETHQSADVERRELPTSNPTEFMAIMDVRVRAAARRLSIPREDF